MKQSNQLTFHASSGKLHAFTLVEMLVVIAVIGILAGLILPVLSKAQGKAKQIYCLNNLRQIGIAGRIAAQDHQDKIPAPAGESSNMIWSGKGFHGWGALIPKYLDGSPKVFFCPSARTFGKDGTNGLHQVGQKGKLAYGSYYMRGFKQGAAKQFVAAGTQALLSDFDTRYPMTEEQWFARNHETGKNVLRGDGGVEFVRAELDSRLYDNGGDSKKGAKDGTWYKLDHPELFK